MNQPILTSLILMAVSSPSWSQTCDTQDIFPSSPLLVPGPNLTLSSSADLDGDGDLDIIAAIFDGNELLVYINNGAGAFTEQPSGATQVEGCTFVDLGDMDGDGVLDAVVIVEIVGTRVARWYRGVGGGVFESSPNIGTTSQTGRLLLSDLDGDGDLDFVGTGLSNQIQFYLNDGSGVFGQATNYPYSFSVFAMGAAELNGDGDVDLVFTGLLSPQEVTVVLSNGAGQFLPPRFYDADPTATSNTIGLAMADLDGDGDNDMVYGAAVPSSAILPSGLWVRFNNGAGDFSDPTIYEGVFEEVIGADFDGDGDIDLAARQNVSFGPEFNRFALLRNDGAGDFSDRADPLPLIVGSSNDLRLTDAGDFDGNGALDLVFPSFEGFRIAYNACTHPPVIGQQPIPSLVAAAEDAEFSIALTSGATPLTYQWRKDGEELADSDGISGANTPTLTIAGVNTGDQGFYDCVVSNPQGTRTSSQALLAVQGGGGSACTADLNNDGALNFFDVSAFISAYSAGCP